MGFSPRPLGWSMPGWVLYMRGAQLFMAFLVLILTAVSAGELLQGADPSWLVTPYPGFGFAWFAFSWTLFYIPVATFVIPNLSAKVRPLIILLVLELLTTLWWLVTFALLADNSSRLASWLDTGYTNAKVGLGLAQSSAAFGAVEFVLFAVVSGFAVRALMERHRNPTSGGAFVPVQEFPKASAPAQPYPSAPGVYSDQVPYSQPQQYAQPPIPQPYQSQSQPQPQPYQPQPYQPQPYQQPQEQQQQPVQQSYQPPYVQSQSPPPQQPSPQPQPQQMYSPQPQQSTGGIPHPQTPELNGPPVHQ
ncbi:hypothetical protein ABEF95_001770 [Exophiala dermatitidis]